MEAKIDWFVIGQVDEQERKLQINSTGLFPAAAAAKEMTVQ